MVQEAQLEAISLFAFQQARLSLSIVVSVKGALFLVRFVLFCLTFLSRILVKLMIGRPEHIFVLRFLLVDRSLTGDMVRVNWAIIGFRLTLLSH